MSLASMAAPASEPSPALRQYLVVALVAADLLAIFLALFILALSAESVDSGPGYVALVGLLVFALSVAATIGVVRRSSWGRVTAIIAGAVLTVTCLGLVLGIPIIVLASLAPLEKELP